MPLPYRIALAGISHESNTFCRIPTTLGSFRVSRGEEVLRDLAGSATEPAGLIAAAKRRGFEVVPILIARATPAGRVTTDALESLTGEVVEGLRRAGRVDAVHLAQHGAMVAEGEDDADGWVLERVREAVGPGVPIALTLDLHANISPRMVRLSDAVVVYDTYPHVDCFERGVEAGEILHRTLAGEVRPVTALAQTALMPAPLAQLPEREPMRGTLARMFEVEREPKVVCAGVAPGFAYADVAEAGLSVVVTADEDRDYAQAKADEIARVAWEGRAGFRLDLPTPEEAVAQAIASDVHPVALVDVGDNVGGGSAADGTALLRELLRQGAQDAVVMIYDPAGAKAAAGAGVGATLTLDVGGKVDALHGDPVRVTGRVRRLSDGVFRTRGPVHGGRAWGDMGLSATLDCDGVRVILTERRMPPFAIQPLYAAGIDPEGERILVVKAALAHRAAYAPVVRRTIEVDTPGVTAANLSRFTYRNVRRPIFPLDEI